MPAYNSELYLQEAVESVLSQTYSNIELLIIDDGSRDASQQIAQSLADQHPQIRLFSQTTNCGVAKVRNIGVENAQGEFLVFADSDDLMLLDRIERSVNYLRNHPDIDFVIGGYRAIDQEGVSLNRGFYFPNYLDNDNILLHQLKRNYLWIGLSTIRSEVAQRYRFDENLPTSEDYDLFLRLVFDRHKFYYLNQPVIQYRIHQSNTSAQMHKSLKATRSILSKYSFDDLFDKLKVHHTNREIYNCFAVVCMTLEAKDQGLYFIEKALAEQNGSKRDLFESYFYAGVLNYLLGYLEISYTYFKQVLEEGYEEPTLYNNLAVLEILLEKSKSYALELLGKALKLQPIYNDALINLRKIELGGKDLLITLKPLRKNPVHYQNMSYE